MSIINVILSGGVGSRLWPLSRKSRPKQYIPIFDDANTLFRTCALRNSKIADRILIVGSVDNYELSRQELRTACISNYGEIIEAAPRNTAASIAFAALTVAPDDILLVTPSDHIISGSDLYEKAVHDAVMLAHDGYLVTFGATPQHPETGYGYIEHNELFDVIAFKEKPDLETAIAYVADGKYLWNSGMFCFKASVYLDELKKHAPAVFEAARRTVEKADGGFLPVKETMEIPSISVDYAVMEHSKIIKVIPFHFEWSDLGSFDALWDYLNKHGIQNNSKNLVLGSDKHVEFIGIENAILVETEDAILIVSRDRAQEVKNVYDRLEKEKPELLK
ncbi:mannose-1-phosphate guanylyltransferase [Taibaiella koreensis]|uniref:mannose-1-phosphate guanylyltransferase n=1 Tax=Taibaiella koreensis TaxID=1268548 RepID=UPI000E59EDE4|nr:sugar phosphate nucleotidyltransferase [Taibaiella koreensis]